MAAKNLEKLTGGKNFERFLAVNTSKQGSGKERHFIVKIQIREPENMGSSPCHVIGFGNILLTPINMTG